MKLYVVVVVDRHTDPEVTVFKSKKKAENYARTYADVISKRGGFVPEDYEEKQEDDGLFRTITYSDEGDCVYVYERKLV